MKTVLIVGAGFGQLPAIKIAKEMGLKVVAVDQRADAPGMPIADYAYTVDTTDFESVLTIAKKHQIDGLLTMQSDSPVPTIGYVNDTLGLAGVSLETALDCSNKVRMRKRLEKYQCNQPRFSVIKDLQQALEASKLIGFPLIVKAPDSSGSRGVVKVNNSEGLSEAIDEAFLHTKGEELLVEEYIKGLELGAQTFSENGICKLVLLHNDIISPPPFMIPVGHSFPFIQMDESEVEGIKEDIAKAIEALGISSGPSNVDLILDERTGKMKVIEIGARIGATCLPELVYYHTGLNWVKETIKSALGQPLSLDIVKNQPVAAFIVSSEVDGVIKAIDFPKEENLKACLEVELTVAKGDKVSKLRKGTDRIGKVICLGESVSEAEENAREILDQIKFSVIE